MASNGTLWLTLCPEAESLLVGEGVMEIMGSPRLIRLLVNPDTHMLLLAACGADDTGAVVVPPISLGQCEIPARSLLKRLRRTMDWRDEAPRAMLGEYIRDYNAVAFRMDDARPVRLRTVPDWR